MSLIFATQLTAVATLALAVLALAAAVLAGLALRRQTQEVGVLLAQNKRDTDERRRNQAARVFLAAPAEPVHLVSPYAQNASDFPVYNAQIWYLNPHGVSAPEDLGMIMPGTNASATAVFPSRDALTDTVLTFRDAEGLLWIRMPDGSLLEQTRATPRDSILAAGRSQPALPAADEESGEAD